MARIKHEILFRSERNKNAFRLVLCAIRDFPMWGVSYLFSLSHCCLIFLQDLGTVLEYIWHH